MKVLRRDSKGADVKKWQLFLHGQGFLFTHARDGIFGEETEAQTKAFQRANRLLDDGIVGNATFGAAMQLGFEAVDFTTEPEAAYPAKPSFDPISGTEARQTAFGPLRYVAAPGDSKESIRITNDFESAKIVRTTIPELGNIVGAHGGRIRFHRDGAEQLRGLWAAWGRSGMLQHVLRWDGAFNPRFIRCSTSSLSNHAFGTAFDINAAENPLGAQPALPGEKGCIFDLVPIAHRFGFYWGGHFTRRDGMHFEIAKVLTAAKVAQELAKI